MDIKKRINARKIVLSYIYQHCFFSAMQKSMPALERQSCESAEVVVQEGQEG
ncbi:MAG: hypothetical protein Q4B28_05345 [bacterium]|nr:hypothetical protein [bacterium]